MKYVIATPGGIIQYNIPIIKMQDYSLDTILKKGCLC